MFVGSSTSRTGWFLAAAAALVHLSVAGAATAANFIEIKPASLSSFNPDAANSRIEITAMSGDGKIIAGRSWDPFRIDDCAGNTCGIRAFEWSVHDTSVRQFAAPTVSWNNGFGFVVANPFQINALSSNGDDALLETERVHYETVLYHQGQVENFRPLVDTNWLRAIGMSADASVAVGNLGAQVFRWTAGSGVNVITNLPNNLPFTAAGVSGDGKVALFNAQRGFTESPTILDVSDPRGNAYRWTTSSGATELPQIPGDAYSHAVATSFDGAVIVGNSVTINAQNYFLDRAVKWTNGQLTQLPGLAGYDWSTPRDVSANGEFTVGIAYNQSPTVYFPGPPADPNDVVPRDSYNNNYESGYSKAVMWEAGGNIVDLQNYLSNHFGLANQLQGWQLLDATSISDDGRVIAGRGIDPQGVSSLWVAELAVPEPCSAAEIALLIVCLIFKKPVRAACS
jgi:uncharacterized membrane protein